MDLKEKRKRKINKIKVQLNRINLIWIGTFSSKKKTSTYFQHRVNKGENCWSKSQTATRIAEGSTNQEKWWQINCHSASIVGRRWIIKQK